MITIDDNYLRNRILNSADVLSNFPSLNSHKTQLSQYDKQCQSCGGAKDAARERRQLLNQIKQELAMMSPEEHRKLKSCLGESNRQFMLPYKLDKRIESVTF